MEENRDMGDADKDFTQDDVILLKEMMLNLEQTIDHIEIKDPTGGETFPGGYIFEFLAKANVRKFLSTLNFQLNFFYIPYYLHISLHRFPTPTSMSFPPCSTISSSSLPQWPNQTLRSVEAVAFRNSTIC